MIFAAINWLSISINLLLVVFVVVCLLMALLILMQRPKQEGLGAAFGGGVTDQVFGARTTNVLQRGTVYLGSLFFILSLTLAILIGKQTKQKTLLDPAEANVEEKSGSDNQVVTPPVEVPATPAGDVPENVALEPVQEELSQETIAPPEVVVEEPSNPEGVVTPPQEMPAPSEAPDAIDPVPTPSSGMNVPDVESDPQVEPVPDAGETNSEEAQ